MYKINNPYKECHIMDLNLMGIHEYKKFHISGLEALVMVLPIAAIGIVIAGSVLPELGFFAECQNIPGGDLCTITLK